MQATEVQGGLDAQSIALLNMRLLFLIQDDVVIGLVHVDPMRYDFVGPPQFQGLLKGNELRDARELQFVSLNVLVKRQQFLLRRRVIGLEETKIEVVLVDGDVQH